MSDRDISEILRGMDDLARRVVALESRSPMTWFQAQVSSVNANGTVDAYVDDDINNMIYEVNCFEHYTPALNDVVWIADLGRGRLMVLGRTLPDPV